MAHRSFRLSKMDKFATMGYNKDMELVPGLEILESCHLEEEVRPEELPYPRIEEILQAPKLWR